jgi:hypothetical protein
MSSIKRENRFSIITVLLITVVCIIAATAAAGAAERRFAFIDQVSEFLGIQPTQTSAIVAPPKEWALAEPVVTFAPTLGDYSNVSMPLNSDTTVTPSATPANVTSINVSTS